MDIIKKVNDDIQEIEYIISHEKQINNKNKTIKNLKITKNIIKLTLPYIITPIISFVSMSQLGHSPINYEHVKESEKILKTIDNLGNITEINQYDEIKDIYNVIYYYHQWKLKDNNEYQRVVNKYMIDYPKFIKDINTKDNQEILRLLNDPDILEKEYIIDNNQTMIETKNNITIDELNEKEYFKIIIYDENNDNFIIREQNILENVNDIIKYILLVTLLECIIKLLYKNQEKKIKEEIRRINQDYTPLDMDTLQKKLVIRKNNLRRLME